MDNILRFSSSQERTPPREPDAQVDEVIICAKCGVKADPLHMGCNLCEDCCDCRPLGT
jgi:hypothetical protein